MLPVINNEEGTFVFVDNPHDQVASPTTPAFSSAAPPKPMPPLYSYMLPKQEAVTIHEICNEIKNMSNQFNWFKHLCECLTKDTASFSESGEEYGQHHYIAETILQETATHLAKFAAVDMVISAETITWDIVTFVILHVKLLHLIVDIMGHFPSTLSHSNYLDDVFNLDYLETRSKLEAINSSKENLAAVEDGFQQGRKIRERLQTAWQQCFQV